MALLIARIVAATFFLVIGEKRLLIMMHSEMYSALVATVIHMMLAISDQPLETILTVNRVRQSAPGN